MGNAMKIGDIIKVHLPGESPWAQCVAIHDDGTFNGRIDNNPVALDLHSYKFGDVVRFKESGPFWEPIT